MSPTAQHYVQQPGVVRREIAGETVLVPVTGNLADLQKLFVLNPVADAAWQCLEREQTMEQLVARITESFDVSSEEAGKDLEELCDALQRLGLLRVVE